jgi:hypothetical protein
MPFHVFVTHADGAITDRLVTTDVPLAHAHFDRLCAARTPHTATAVLQPPLGQQGLRRCRLDETYPEDRRQLWGYELPFVLEGPRGGWLEPGTVYASWEQALQAAACLAWLHPVGATVYGTSAGDAYMVSLAGTLPNGDPRWHPPAAPYLSICTVTHTSEFAMVR